MNSFVIVFVPGTTARGDFEAALRKHVDSAEFIEVPAATRSEGVKESEHLPLWQWFVSSK